MRALLAAVAAEERRARVKHGFRLVGELRPARNGTAIELPVAARS